MKKNFLTSNLTETSEMTTSEMTISEMATSEMTTSEMTTSEMATSEMEIENEIKFFEKTTKGIQNTMRNKDIKKEIEGYYVLKNKREKKVLESLEIYKNWIKYINIDNYKFRFGGLLYKVNYPDYIMLLNPRDKVIWMVKLDKNILFIKNLKFKKN